MIDFARFYCMSLIETICYQGLATAGNAAIVFFLQLLGRMLSECGKFAIYAKEMTALCAGSVWVLVAIISTNSLLPTAVKNALMV